MADLLVRAAKADHLVTGELLSPGGTGVRALRPAISQLVAEAPVARARPVLAEQARAAGVPFLVDPDSPLLQVPVHPQDGWVALPYGQSEAVRSGDLKLDELVELSVGFQLEAGATMVIPPYFYASDASDPWYLHTVNAISASARLVADHRLTVFPVFCAQLQGFSSQNTFADGIDLFCRVSLDAGASAVAICMSPTGGGHDGYAKVLRLFELALRAKRHGLKVIAWRQGVYGPALVAAGIDGYECGAGTAEITNVSARQASRKTKRPKDKQGGGAGGIYFEPLGRSVPRRVGALLLRDGTTCPRVMCDDEGCCRSVSDTLERPRQHAIRTRARRLREIAEQPHYRWRLNEIAQHSGLALTLATQVNRVLESRGGVRQYPRVGVRTLESLARVAGHLAGRTGDLTA